MSGGDREVPTPPPGIRLARPARFSGVCGLCRGLGGNGERGGGGARGGGGGGTLTSPPRAGARPGRVPPNRRGPATHNPKLRFA